MQKFLTIAIFFGLCFGFPAESQQNDVSLSWKWEQGKLENLSDSLNADFHKSMQEVHLVMPVPFELTSDSTTRQHTFQLTPLSLHESLKIAAIDDVKIVSVSGYESVTVRQTVANGEFRTVLIDAKYNQVQGTIKGTVNLYFDEITPKNEQRAGNCFKCSGKGKLGSWCTFCHNFVSWCIHGGSLRTCDSCKGVGWIETYWVRCPKCHGRGWVGSWCPFCHNYVTWCIHGHRWFTCGTCHGKGAISNEYSTCGQCRGRGWVGSWCPFCKTKVMWCVHGRSPVTCSKCHGKGCVK